MADVEPESSQVSLVSNGAGAGVEAAPAPHFGARQRPRAANGVGLNPMCELDHRQRNRLGLD
jgi:hypothetical protein